MLNRKQKLILFLYLLFSTGSIFSYAGFSPLKDTSFTNHKTSIPVIDPIKTRSEKSASTVEIPLHPSLSSFVKKYHENFEDFFEKLKRTKLHHLNTIDKVFIQSGLPAELKYLAIVESKLNTNALSGCGAVGLWQFMPATAKKFGLRIKDSYDERKHTWKSSMAAAKYLQYLYKFFDDWLLVIAAYNSGPAPVLSAIKKSGSRNFWQLQYFLPKETRMHVKKFIATHFYFEENGSLVTMSKNETEILYASLAKANNNNVPEETPLSLYINSGNNPKWISLYSIEKK